MRIQLGRWTEESLDGFLKEAAALPDVSGRIDFLSGRFIGVPYQPHTLIGGPDEAEEFVINLAAVDCFTLLDYVEAMRRSGSFDAFIANLRDVRYREGEVGYASRNHFLADWIECGRGFVRDVTRDIAAGKAVRVRKTLNRKEDGTPYLHGLPEVVRDVCFIPAGSITNEVIERLRAGDYLGMYSNEPGLDVTHVGIVIRNGGDFLRHASSAKGVRKVVDQPLGEYLSGKPGIIVIRPVA